ncbi:MAG: N-acetyltransferase [Blastochloris sp.]|nr:N-acetyltransferase [Blastochloris sp.]
MPQHMDTTESAATISQAIERNTVDFLWRWDVYAAPKSDTMRSSGSLATQMLTIYNCVVGANLTTETVDEAIQDSIARFSTHGVPGCWRVGPSMRPLDIPERLGAAGFQHAGDEPGVAINLSIVSDVWAHPEGLTIKRVYSEQELDIWTQILAVDFYDGAREARLVGTLFRQIGLEESAPWHHYIGYLHTEPVATLSLFYHAGVVGLYYGATIPSARRRGILNAMVHSVLHDARKLGYRLGVCGASAMSYSIGMRMGFQEYCRFGVYVWKPSTASTPQ